MHESLVESIAEGRHVTPEKARKIVDEAPYLAEEAVTLGLADGTAYEDELTKPKASSAARYMGARRAARLGPVLPRPSIAVIRVHGAIAHGTGGAPALVGSFAFDRVIIRAIRAARRSRRVRGVVLHIDSPGGSALASDRIHHELVALARDKPLVACMANVAASGGYYVAAAAHSIVAQPTTLTGSIGVVAARFVTEPLLDRLGIVREVVKRGARADLMTPRPLRDDEREALMREIDGVYRAFVRVVAEGRKRPTEEIEKVAEGRVWSGRDAKSVGLVDELGGFDLALDLVRKRIGKGSERLEPVVLAPPRRSVPPLPPPGASALLPGLLRTVGVAEEGDLLLLSLLAASEERMLAWSSFAAAANDG
jgi:protease-4